MNAEVHKSTPPVIYDVADLKKHTVYEDKDQDVFIFNGDQSVYLVLLGEPDVAVYQKDELKKYGPFTELDGSLTIFNG